MLPLATVQEIKRLLDDGGLSQRKIAKRLEVSRGVVAAIANGKRGLHGRESNRRDEEPDLGPRTRCRSCGHLVYQPCVYCRAEAYQRRQRQQAARSANSPKPSPGPRDRQSR